MKQALPVVALVLGSLIALTGVFLAFGLPWLLIVGGAALVAAALLVEV